MTSLYWEEFSDQNPNDFEYIGVNDQYEPITALDSQVTELRRKYGRNCIIKIAREQVS